MNCDRCREPIPPPAPGAITTGYALTADDETICYPCADAQSQADIAAIPDSYCAYVSSDEKNITTWTGGALMRVVDVTRTRSGFGGWRKNGGLTHYRARDSQGVIWYGRGAGAGMAIILRPSVRSIRSLQTVRNVVQRNA